MHTATQGFRGGAPDSRVRAVNDAATNPSGEYVLYWMIANRRTRFNFSLDRAVAWARELGRPLVVLEALRVDYPYASERLHRFAIDGMAANARAFEGSAVLYYPYVEPSPGAGKGLLDRLSEFLRIGHLLVARMQQRHIRESRFLQHARFSGMCIVSVGITGSRNQNHWSIIATSKSRKAIENYFANRPSADNHQRPFCRTRRRSNSLTVNRRHQQK